MSEIEVHLAEIREMAEAQARAYAQMLVYGNGVGGMSRRHPEMFKAMLAWGNSTENDHADTVLELLDRVEAVAVTSQNWFEKCMSARTERESLKTALTAAESRASEAEVVIAKLQRHDDPYCLTHCGPMHHSQCGCRCKREARA